MTHSQAVASLDNKVGVALLVSSSTEKDIARGATNSLHLR
jgi:hypothetical protein